MAIFIVQWWCSVSWYSLCKSNTPQQSRMSTQRPAVCDIINTSTQLWACKWPLDPVLSAVTARRYASAVSAMALCLCICLCVYITSRSSIESAWRIQLFFWHGVFFQPIIRCQKIRVGLTPKISVIPSGTLSQTLDLKKFRHCKSFVIRCCLIKLAEGPQSSFIYCICDDRCAVSRRCCTVTVHTVYSAFVDCNMEHRTFRLW